MVHNSMPGNLTHMVHSPNLKKIAVKDPEIVSVTRPPSPKSLRVPDVAPTNATLEIHYHNDTNVGPQTTEVVREVVNLTEPLSKTQ